MTIGYINNRQKKTDQIYHVMELERLYFNNGIIYIPKIDKNYYPVNNNLILTTDTTDTTNCTNLIYDLINNVINYTSSIFYSIYLLANFILNLIIFPIKKIIILCKNIYIIFTTFCTKIKKKIFIIDDLKKENEYNLKEIKDLKLKIEMQKDSTKITILKKDNDLNKFNKEIKITCDKLKLSINKNKEQQIIIDTLRKEIKNLKDENKNIKQQENSVQKAARKAAAKAAKKNK